MRRPKSIIVAVTVGVVICAAICPSVNLRLTPATLPGVSGRPTRASALSRDNATFFCDHWSEKGVAVNNAAPTIIPSVLSFFMIGLHDDLAAV